MKPNQVAESLPKSEALNLRATQGIVIDAASRFTTTKDRITDLLGPDETYGSPFHIDLELIEQWFDAQKPREHPKETIILHDHGEWIVTTQDNAVLQALLDEAQEQAESIEIRLFEEVGANWLNISDISGLFWEEDEKKKQKRRSDHISWVREYWNNFLPEDLSEKTREFLNTEAEEYFHREQLRIKLRLIMIALYGDKANLTPIRSTFGFEGQLNILTKNKYERIVTWEQFPKMTLTFDPKNILTQYTKLTETLDTRDTMYRIPDNKRISSNELEKSEKMSPPPGIFEISWPNTVVLMKHLWRTREAVAFSQELSKNSLKEDEVRRLSNQFREFSIPNLIVIFYALKGAIGDSALVEFHEMIDWLETMIYAYAPLISELSPVLKEYKLPTVKKFRNFPYQFLDGVIFQSAQDFHRFIHSLTNALNVWLKEFNKALEEMNTPTIPIRAEVHMKNERGQRDRIVLGDGNTTYLDVNQIGFSLGSFVKIGGKLVYIENHLPTCIHSDYFIAVGCSQKIDYELLRKFVPDMTRLKSHAEFTVNLIEFLSLPIMYQSIIIKQLLIMIWKKEADYTYADTFRSLLTNSIKESRDVWAIIIKSADEVRTEILGRPTNRNYFPLLEFLFLAIKSKEEGKYTG